MEINNTELKLKNIEKNKILKFDIDILTSTYNSKKEELTIIDDFDLL